MSKAKELRPKIRHKKLDVPVSFLEALEIDSTDIVELGKFMKTFMQLKYYKILKTKIKRSSYRGHICIETKFEKMQNLKTIF